MAETLPVEVVSHIMRYLSLSDRKDAALVNKKWYEAAMDPILQQDVVINFHTPSITEAPIIGFGRRKSPNLVLNNIDGSSHSREVIQKACQYMGLNLHSLSLKGSDITEGTFMSIVPYCHHLVSLDLSCCNSLFMSGKLLEKPKDQEKVKSALHNLKELNLSSIRFLSDSLFSRIMSCVPNVEKLALASCHLAIEFDPYRGHKGRNSESILTFANVLKYIKGHARTLKSLDLSRTAVTNECLTSLVNVPDLQLREISLKSCRDLSDEGIAVLAKTQTGLRKIDISSCQDLQDRSVVAIQQHLHELEHLNIAKCRYISDVAVKELCLWLPNLTYINMSDCYQLTSQALIKGLCPSNTSSIVSLYLNCCSLVQDDVVLAMSKVMKDLTELELSSCFPLTDKSVNIIAKSFGKLRLLRLGWCKEITDVGLLGLEKYIYQDEDDCKEDVKPNGREGLKMKIPGKQNEYSSGRFSRNYGNIGMFSAPADGESNPPKKISYSEIEKEMRKDKNTAIYMLRGLQSLSLNACQHITDVGISLGIRFCELKHLDLSMCPKITDEGLKAIAQNNRSLEEVRVSQCQKITDTGVTMVARNLIRLVLLDLSSCDNVTDQSLVSLSKYCRCLRHLDVSMCGQITRDGVDKLANKIKDLAVQARYIGGGLEYEVFVS
ncbi:uncharacterized protein [Ptychodera flava]|uniref:uncharacterized protein n=1 Tax=Ptychodera flava TaxID=63121 RepID=UPI00396A2799